MILIKNGKVWTMSQDGIKEDTDILIDEDKIIAIGKNITNDQATIIDASGLNVLPGFVDAHSHIGGFRVDSMEDDLNELTNSCTPQLDALYGIDPNSLSFGEVIKAGITTSGITPGSGNVICGTACAVKSAGSNMEKRVIKNPIALKAAMGVNPKGVYGPKGQLPMSRLGIAQVLREFFLTVKDYQLEKTAHDIDNTKPFKFDQGMENGLKVLNKEIPLKVHSYQHDMLTMIAIAKEFDFKLTLDHALGASDFIDEIIVSKAAIIYGPIGCSIFPGELCKIDIACLVTLDKKGVLCAIMTDGPCLFPEYLVVQAGEVVRFGGEIERVLRMLTINPAKIIGCEDRIGSLEVGKDADLVIFDKTPALDTDAEVRYTIINGKVCYQKQDEHFT